jgi:tRNA (guanine37-N1)-methyltransferase
MKPKNLREALKKKLNKTELSHLRTSFDSIGDIAILDIPAELVKKEKIIAKAVLDTHSQFKVIAKRATEHVGKYRVRKIKVLAGENRTWTEHKESGARMKVDVNKTYFSPRSSTERLRVANQVKKKENVLVLFSGIAPFPLVIAKNAGPESITAVELNPSAHKLAKESLELNKKLKGITLIRADAKKWLSTTKGTFDRIIMPLPHTAEEFLPAALKRTKKGSTIHFYTFDEKGKFTVAREKAKAACKKVKKKCRILRVVKAGQQKPGHYRVCVDIRIL